MSDPTAGYVQVAPDSSGKRIGNVAVTLPVGTVVTDGDGNQTALSAATTVFLQRVILCDSTGAAVDSFVGEDRQEEIIVLLTKICIGIGKLVGDPFLNDE